MNCLALLLALQVSGINHAIPQERVRFKFKVPSSFLKKGSLWIGNDRNDGMGFPVEAFRALFYRNGKRVFRVKQFSDLKGFVHIPNGNEALDYVRLKTSPATFQYFEQANSLELIRASRATLKWFGNDKHKFERRSPSMFGLIPDKYWIEADDLQVTKLGGVYNITRSLFRRSDKGVKKLRVCEAVTAEGEVKEVVQKVEDSTSGQLAFPSYE